MSELDDCIEYAESEHPFEAHDARAELAQLRATVAEQARQLAEAREIFDNIFKRDWSNGKINDKARSWLAAHPAPQADEAQ